MTLNIFFSSTQQSKCFNLVLQLLASRIPASTVAITLHSKTKTFLLITLLITKTKSLIDYIITDCSTINDTIICDSIVKSDHFATLSLLGLHIETKKVPVQKKFFDKKNYNALDFKHCLEQNWQKMYVQNN